MDPPPPPHLLTRRLRNTDWMRVLCVASKHQDQTTSISVHVWHGGVGSSKQTILEQSGGEHEDTPDRWCIAEGTEPSLGRRGQAP